jgi:hypothetical protein
MLSHTKGLSRLLGVRSALLLPAAFACLFASCQSPSNDSGDSTKTAPKSEVEKGQMNVKVEGATATHEGDTLKIEYPVLKDKNDRIPDWVINPGFGGVTGAVGVASRKGLGTKEQLDEARLNARLEIASMLEARVQNAGRSELEENTRVAGDNLSEESRKSRLKIERDILDMVLAGTRQRALWFDPDNGECYIWIVLDGRLRDVVDQQIVEGVSVFVANTPVANEYKPVRRKAPVPKVYVQQPDRRPEPKPEAAPVPEKTQKEKLEDTLKPIETIPSKADPKKGRR